MTVSKLENTDVDQILDDEEQFEQGLEQELNGSEDQGQPAVKAKSPAETLVVHQKKRIKELENQLKSQSQKDTRAAKIEEFKAKGYDEDTATLYADQEMSLAEMKAWRAEQEFKSEHVEVLRRYPQAGDDINWLMKTAEVSGMTVEQICIGKFGNSIQAQEQRNRLSQQTVPGAGNDAVARAARGATPPAAGEQSADLQAKRSKMENFLGKPLTEQEWTDMRQRRGW